MVELLVVCLLSRGCPESFWHGRRFQGLDECRTFAGTISSGTAFDVVCVPDLPQVTGTMGRRIAPTGQRSSLLRGAMDAARDREIERRRLPKAP
jgi:hypothetical protein